MLFDILRAFDTHANSDDGKSKIIKVMHFSGHNLGLPKALHMGCLKPRYAGGKMP